MTRGQGLHRVQLIISATQAVGAKCAVFELYDPNITVFPVLINTHALRQKIPGRSMLESDVSFFNPSRQKPHQV